MDVVTNIDPNRIHLDGLGNVTTPWDGAVTYTESSVSILHDDMIRYLPGEFIDLGLEVDCPSAAPILDVQGTRPGMAEVSVTEVTPGGTLAVLKGVSFGSSVVAVGPCTGTLLDLDGPSFVTTINDNDHDGHIFVTPTLPAGLCGQPVQLLDLDSCTPSNPVLLP